MVKPVTERGEGTVTEWESALLCTGILIGAFGATFVIGLLALILRYAALIDGTP